MKKRGILVLVAATMLLIDVPIQAATASAPATRENLTTAVSHLASRPRRGAKPRRGGLFNTGLFRKKNACGCPKH